jgi:hypothetical protein
MPTDRGRHYMRAKGAVGDEREVVKKVMKRL